MSASKLFTAGDIGVFRGGSGFPTRYQGRKSGELPFFKVSDMNTPGNELFMHRANNCISEFQRKDMGAVRIPARAIVFAKVGAAVFLERKRILAQDSCIDNNMAAFIVDESRVDVRFAHYLLTAFNMSSLVATTALPSLNGSQLRSIPLLIPEDIQEQRRIVAALGDADDLIATLERLIAKKHAIKQGITHQLVTGQTRLAGLSARWLGVRLRDAGFTYGGLTGKTKEDFGTGSASFVTFMEVIAGPRLLGQRLERVRVRPNERQNPVRLGDVLFNGSSETPEEVALSAVIDFEPHATTFLNSFCFGYRLKRNDLIDPAYLAYFFRSDAGRMSVMSLAQGATRYNIAKTKFLGLSLELPSVDEQRAIVTILRDCEDEIEAVKQRLAKARDVKQGMMQELLTGRTRLPVAEVAA
jgi:type I restriction enzyme S subunit